MQTIYPPVYIMMIMFSSGIGQGERSWNESFMSSLILAYISQQRELKQLYVEQSSCGDVSKKRNAEILGSLEAVNLELLVAKEKLMEVEKQQREQVGKMGDL